MIDFSQFDTPLQKLIALYLHTSQPNRRQIDISNNLCIDNGKCRNCLQEFEKLGFVKKCRTIYGTIVYVPEALPTVPEALSTVPEALSTVPEALSTVPEALSTVPEALSTVPAETPLCENPCPTKEFNTTNKQTTKGNFCKKKKPAERSPQGEHSGGKRTLHPQQQGTRQPTPAPFPACSAVSGGFVPADGTLPACTASRAQHRRSVIPAPPAVAPSPSSRAYATAGSGAAVPHIVVPHRTEKVDPSSQPAGWQFDGRIYSAELEREKYLDRMLADFADVDLQVPQNELRRVGAGLETKYPFQYFAACCRTAQHIIYGTKAAGIVGAEFTRKIREELNHRFAYAIARKVPELADEYKIKTFLTEMPNTPKERQNFFLFRLRDVFYNNRFGWASNLFDTHNGYVNEERNRKAAGLEIRSAYFPVYLRLLRYEEEAAQRTAVKQPPPVKEPPKTNTQEFVKRQRNIEIINDEFQRLAKEAGLGNVDYLSLAAFRTLYGDVTDVESVIKAAVDMSAAMQRLSAVKCSEKMLELQRVGWKQYQSRFWFPPVAETDNSGKDNQ